MLKILILKKFSIKPKILPHMRKKVVFTTYVGCDFVNTLDKKQHKGPVHMYPNVFKNKDFSASHFVTAEIFYD